MIIVNTLESSVYIDGLYIIGWENIAEQLLGRVEHRMHNLLHKGGEVLGMLSVMNILFRSDYIQNSKLESHYIAYSLEVNRRLKAINQDLWEQYRQMASGEVSHRLEQDDSEALIVENYWLVNEIALHRQEKLKRELLTGLEESLESELESLESSEQVHCIIHFLSNLRTHLNGLETDACIDQRIAHGFMALCMRCCELSKTTQCSEEKNEFEKIAITLFLYLPKDMTKNILDESQVDVLKYVAKSYKTRNSVSGGQAEGINECYANFFAESFVIDPESKARPDLVIDAFFP